MQPAVLVYRLSRRFGHFVVTFHYIITARTKFADLSGAERLAGLGVNDLRFNAGERASDGVDAALDRVVGRRLRTAGRRLGLTVGYGYFGHTHLVNDLTHDLYRTGRTRHYAGAEVEFELLEPRMTEHRDKHRRNAVDCRTFRVLQGFHDLYRTVIFDRHHRRSVRDARHGRKHQTETMVERNGYAEAVGGREFHAVADSFAVVQYIVMRQHNALREARRTRRVLHIDDVVRRKTFSRLGVNIVGNVHVIELFPVIHTGVRFLVDRYDLFEHGQTFRLNVRAVGALFQHFGAETVHYVDVTRVLEAVAHNEHFRVRLFEQIFRFVDLVTRVDGDEYGADLGAGKQSQEPLRIICCPDSDVVVLFDAEREKSARDLVRLVVKFFVGAFVLKIMSVDDCRLVGMFRRHLVHPFADGFVDEFHNSAFRNKESPEDESPRDELIKIRGTTRFRAQRARSRSR